MADTNNISFDERRRSGPPTTGEPVNKYKCDDGAVKKSPVSLFYEPHPDAQTRDAYYSGMPSWFAQQKALEKKQNPHRGFVARVNSFAEFYAAALQPNAKGVSWDRGTHSDANEIVQWVATQKEDETIASFAREKLLVAPLSESHHDDCGDPSCRNLPISGPDDVCDASARLVARLPAAFREGVRADAEALATLLMRMCPKAALLQMSLSVVGKNCCGRWHQDNYVGRGIITYAGPSTWLVDDSVVSFEQFAATVRTPKAFADPRIVPFYHCIQMPPTNAVTLMKGNKWPGVPHGMGLTHKSPNMKTDSRGNPVSKRLMLKIDLANR
eukprot:Hpha_TRINITY_DN16646_c0_g1::TRINITY_DN16646_c0_g1_i2::g.179508::m.179508